MEIPSAPLNILTFPQKWDGAAKQLFLNVLLLPKGDPFADFAPGFPDANLTFATHIISGLEKLPTMVAAGPTLTVDQDSIERRQFFDALVATFDQPNSGFQVRPHLPGDVLVKPTAIKKYLTSSYQRATRFASPRTTVMVTDESYECALRDGTLEKFPGTPASRRFYWEEILSFVLRQPLLAVKLGLIYKGVSLTFQNNPFEKGGYLYVDLGADSDLLALKRQRFAARIPPLANQPRVLFAPVLFPVDPPPLGNFDQVFPEAELYDDGFAKVIHGIQPARAALLESDRSSLPAPKDVGIRLAWDDEQVAIWLNRQLGINAVDPSLDPPPSPLGVGGYRIDVFDETNNAWRSLMTVEGDLKLNDLLIGHFDGELPVEVLPVNFDNKAGGEFWLPSYFTAWAGGSLAVVDRTPYEIAGDPQIPGPEIYKPIGFDAVPLRYGNDYKFRVRLMDLTGGGPDSGEDPIHPAPAGVVTVPFRRYVPPKSVSILPGGGVSADGLTAAFEIRKPELAYPDVVFTGKYADPISDLKAQSATAQLQGREPALPDLDVTSLRVEVQVRTLSGDPAAKANTGQPFVPVYTAIRSFNADPLEVNFELVDMHNLSSLEGGVFPDNAPLPLPNARAIRLVFTPVGFEDPTLDYWGSQEARVGAVSMDAYVHAPSNDERNLFLAASTSEIEAIFLQPDPARNANLKVQMEAAGLRHEAPSDLVDRLAHQIDLPVKDLTFSSPAGQRTVFGCSRGLRHVLNPDCSSISFGSKADLTRQWIVRLQMVLDRDWSWYSPGHLASLIKQVPDPDNPGKDKVVFPPEPVSFEIHRREGVGPFGAVGAIVMPGTVNSIAAQNPDREHTRLVFFDAYDPKPTPGQPLVEPELTYKLVPVFRDNIAQIDSRQWTLRVPITTPPAQVPKIVSAGFAFSAYQHDERYSATEERRRMLFLEFDSPVLDKKDRYFARVLAYGPDPMLHDSEVPSPEEPPLPVSPELIRVVTPTQSADCAGINAMQELAPSSHSDRHYLLPLPPGLNPDSPELLGFFVYELRVGHDCSRWSTAQARFGHPLRMTGVQHPAPQLRCSVMRTEKRISVSAPFAAPVWQGENLRPPRTPKSRLQGLLYAQVLQIDGEGWRNVLLLSAMGAINFNDIHIVDEIEPRLVQATMEFQQIAVLNSLHRLGLPLDSKLSVIAVELLPEPKDSPFNDPLGRDLGQVRILRTSLLTPVPDICPPATA